MTDTSPSGGAWLTIKKAAALLGLSRSGFRDLAHREGIQVRRRGRLPGASAAGVEVYLKRARSFLVAEAAEQLGLNMETFRLEARRQGIYPSVAGTVRRAELMAWVERTRVEPGELVRQLVL